MKKLFLMLIGTALFIVAVGYLTKRNQSESEEITISGIKVRALIADSPEKRQRGLGGKSSLSQTEGLLFIFDQKDIQPSFWMKDMLIPIDIIWINDGKIVQIDKNIPAPAKESKDADLKFYFPSEPIDYVLEVIAGFSDKNKIKVGDPVSIN